MKYIFLSFLLLFFPISIKTQYNENILDSSLESTYNQQSEITEYDRFNTYFGKNIFHEKLKAEDNFIDEINDGVGGDGFGEAVPINQPIYHVMVGLIAFLLTFKIRKNLTSIKN